MVLSFLFAIAPNEPNVKPVSAPVTVVGDVHGQFYDVIELFNIGGRPPFTNYLFMGDYVDRGMYGLEVVGYLLAQKVLHPHKIHMLRGNHETRAVNGAISHYQKGSFVWQCLNRFGIGFLGFSIPDLIEMNLKRLRKLMRFRNSFLLML